MSKQRCQIVVVKRYSSIAMESIDEAFINVFGKCNKSIRSRSTHENIIITFYLDGKNIDRSKIKLFVKFLESNGFIKLYSSLYSESEMVDVIDTRFFSFNLNLKHFSDIKDLLVSKIEAALGKKLKVYKDDIYYFDLTKSQIKSRKLVRLIDELLENPAINILICL
jgi:hypothetical protein